LATSDGGFVLSRSRLHDDNVESIACDTLADLLSSVADSSLDQGLVPIENAIEGTVSATIDGLVFDHELVIVQESSSRYDCTCSPGPASRLRT